MSYEDPVDELLDASDLGAVYFPSSQGPDAEGTLRITGKYSATNPIKFVRFQRKTLIGGLCYEVLALVYNPALKEYTGPIPDHDTTIKLPNEAIQSDTITIVTKKKPVKVEIRYLQGPPVPFPESNEANSIPIDTDNNATTKKAPKDVLLKASDLDATYYAKSQTLRLKGKFTSDHFVQFARFSVKKDWVGGIAYEVRGFQWNPVLEHHKGPVPDHDKIIELPNPVLPSNTVVFFGAEDQKITVDINMLDAIAPPFAESDSSGPDTEVGIDQQNPSQVGVQQTNSEVVPSDHDTLLEGKDFKATYHFLLGGPGTLVLDGKYTAFNPVHDARFIRVEWLGGLAFDVRGKVAWPVVEEYTGDVKSWVQKLTLPDYVKDIVFFIAGGKKVVVPIEFTEVPPPKITIDSLLDASNLHPVYYSFTPGTGTLVLDGDYTSQALVNDPHFQKVEWIGGLKFEVRGFVTHDGVMPRPLPIGQFSEEIDDLKTKDVIFVVKGDSGEESKEIVVPIEFREGGLLPGSSTKQVFSQGGFQPVLSLLQTSDLAAFYIFELGSAIGTLTLSGNYIARHPVTDAHFERKQDWVGGLAYNVEGVVDYPAILENTRPVNSLSVEIPFVDVFPSKQIVFFTEKGRQKVHIEFVPLLGPPITSTVTGTTDIKQPSVSTREISVPLSEVN